MRWQPVSDMPAPQFGDKPSSFSSYLLNVLLQLANKNGIENKQKKRIFVSAWIRAASSFKRFVKMFSHTPQDEFADPRLKTTGLRNVGASTAQNRVGPRGQL
jgi:hypothetical protein